MSATEELRRMLDERGVEWTKPKSALENDETDWERGEWEFCAIEGADDELDLTAAYHEWCTAAQAIEATLWRGTCRFIDDSDGEFPPKCSACGYEPSIYECSWLCDGGYKYEGNYCSNCGARVVEVDE